MENSKDTPQKIFTPMKWLIEPFNEMDRANRRNARLLAGLILFTTINLIIGQLFSPSFVLLIGIGILTVAYFLARTKHYQIGGGITITFLSLLVLVYFNENTPNIRINIQSLLTWSILPVLIASTFLSLRWTTIIIIGNLALSFIPPYLYPHLDIASIVEASQFTWTFFPLILVAKWHWGNMENDRQLELKEINDSLKRSENELKISYNTTLEGWAKALELKDKETEGHTRRVTTLSLRLGEKIGLSEEEINNLYYGALLHDIGKMGIPDEILNKPGPLTSEERAIVEKHPDDAYKLLKDIDYLQAAMSIPYSHHEKWDGTGYPQGLKGEEIPLFARIFTIVDNWDALTSKRPYRDAWSEEKTIDYIKENSGIFFDPQIIDTFFDTIITNQVGKQ